MHTSRQCKQQTFRIHKQVTQDANNAYNQDEQDAKSAYNAAISGTHGNAAIIGPAMATRDQAIATAQTTKINAIVAADVAHDKAVNDAFNSPDYSLYISCNT